MTGFSTLAPDAASSDGLDCCDFGSIFSGVHRQELCLSLPSNRRLIPAVLVMFREINARIGDFPDRDQSPICVALEEALMNAMVHGNLEVSSKLRDLDDDSFEELISLRIDELPYANRRVKVVARYNDIEASFTITDEGPGFDPNAVADPTDDEHVMLTHGRGLFLMRSFMDEVIHNASGNQVTLIKRKAVSND